MSRQGRFGWWTAQARRFAKQPRRCSVASPYTRRLGVEQLEDRRLLAVLTVQNDLDDTLGNLAGDGELSLREAIEIANNPGTTIDGFSSNDVDDTIEFASPFFDTARTIALNAVELQITETLTITGSGQELLTIDAQQNSRVINFFATTSDLTLNGVMLQNGKTTGSFENGGGIRFYSSGALTLTSSTVSGNSSNADGGGIYAVGTVSLANSTVSGNSITGPFASGGGIFANIGAVSLTNSTVSGNSTTGTNGSGGGIYAGIGAVSLTNSTASGNSTTGTNGSGGGIYAGMGTVSLTNSTVSGNSSLMGGGIYTFFGSVSLTNSTVSGNEAEDGGGGIYGPDSGSNPTITIENSIVAGNSDDGTAPDLKPQSGSTLTINHSLIGDTTGSGVAGATGTGNLLDQPALLGPLADNGGPTWTHALLPGSPALDAGSTTEITDQRGLARPIDLPSVPGGTGNASDIGAYEAQVAPSANFDSDSDIDGLDFLSWQRGFGSTAGAVRTNGNSDDDGDVDRSDLAAWASTYGQVELIVRNLNDAGPGSLRELITFANNSSGANEIFFDVSGTIAIDSQLPTIAEELTIAGPGASLLTIDAQLGGDGLTNGNGWRIFEVDDGTAAVIDFKISGLTLTGGDVSGNGGAIDNRENLTVTSSNISGNSAHSEGGGIYNFMGTLSVSGSTVSGNSVSSGDYGSSTGGGISNVSGTTTITSSTLSGNSASSGNDGYSTGGGISNTGSGATTTVTSSTLSGNSASSGDGGYSFGGGIYNSSGTTTVTSSTLSGNSASSGDGGYSFGGGFFNFTGTSTVTNSIIANSLDGGDVEVSLGAFTGSNNLIEDGSGGLADTVSGDPLLGPLADNGGPTETHALLIDSTAINAGSDPLGQMFDQRGAGFDRVQFGSVDIGAFEFQESVVPANLIVSNLADVVDNDFSPGNLTLREAQLIANIRPGSDTIMFDAILFATPQTILLDSQLPTITEELTITGPGEDLLTIDAQQNSRVLSFSSATDNLTISGLTLQNGLTTGTDDGAGIRFDSSGTLTLTNTIVSSNTSADDGGGIWSSDGNVTLTDSTVSGNSTIGDDALGAGIYAFAGNVSLTNSTVSGNSHMGNDGLGGGILAYYGNVSLTSSTVSGNNSYAGGGIVTGYGSVSLTSSTVSGNNSYAGGGIFTSHGSVSLTSSTVSGNNSYAGGGILTVHGSVSLTSSTVSGNTSSGRGGGIWTRSGSVSLTSSTITANEAGAEGGGIFVYNDPANPNFTIENSIVAGNSDNGTAPDLRPDPGITLTINHSLIGVANGLSITGNIGNQTGTLAAPLDPLLGPLADNGGPTETHALLIDSTAINAGSDPLGQMFDQRGAGFDRVQFGSVDIGAFEFQEFDVPAALIVSNLADVFDNDFSPENLTLREALTLANILPAETITFDAILFATPQTILLDSQLPTITEELTITGPGEDLLTIDAQQNSRVLSFSSATDNLTISGLTLQNGLTTGTDDGAGIRFDSSGTLTLTNTIVSSNTSADDGGGIWSSDGNVTLTDSTVSGNSTTGDNGNGAGIHTTSGSLSLTRSTVSGNSTTGYFGSGAGIYTNTGSVSLTSSTVSGNSTTGGLAFGAGIFSVGGNVSVTSSTVTANEAGAEGGGIFVNDVLNPTFTLINSIVAGNTDNGTAPDLRPDPGSTITINYNLIGATGLTIGGTGNLVGTLASPINPLLGPLMDHGGPTLTHGLIPGSVAIDAGNSTLATDQRGLPRTINLPDVTDEPGSNGSDIGAFERQHTLSLNWVGEGKSTSAFISANWDDPADFSPDRVPNSLDNLLLDSSLGNQTVNLVGETLQVNRVESLATNTDAYTFTNGTLEMFHPGGNTLLTRNDVDPAPALIFDTNILFGEGSTAPRFNILPTSSAIVVNGNIAPSPGRTDALTLELTSRNTLLASSITVSGVISDGLDGAVLSLTAGFGPDSVNHTGTIKIEGNNTYTGQTIVNGAALEFNSIANVDIGGVGVGFESALGAPRTIANGTIRLGALDVSGLGTPMPGKLHYTGSGDTTDRVIELAADGSGGVFESSGTGALVLTAPAFTVGAGAKTLTLGGTNTDGNEIQSVIPDGTVPLDLEKTGSGTWIVAAANTYTGATTVSGGTLLVNNTSGSGTGTGAVTVEAGATLGGTGSIAGDILVESGGIVSPGDGIGTLTVDNLDVDSSATTSFLFEIDGATHDKIIGTGSQGRVITDGQLVVRIVGAEPINSDTFTIIDADNLDTSFDNILPGFDRVTTEGGEGSFLVTIDIANDDLILSDYTPTSPLAAATAGSNLIDAAIAYNMAYGSSVTKVTQLVEPPNFPETATDRALARDDFSPALLEESHLEMVTTDSSEMEEAGEPWLTDELLEQVFG